MPCALSAIDKSAQYKKKLLPAVFLEHLHQHKGGVRGLAGVSPLANPKHDEVIHEGHFWRIIVNPNQNLLGRCFIALKRHEQDLFRLSPAEMTELWRLAANVRQALRELFQTDHFNYAFLGNSDRHLHLHIVPRYRGTRFFAGLVFDDKAWGHHYDLIPRRVPPEVAHQLVAALRERLRPFLATKLEKHRRSPERIEKKSRGRPPQKSKSAKAKRQPKASKKPQRKRRR
jgi:diadenosine tetraphosphate (Ap4A) HIT family hydrolase